MTPDDPSACPADPPCVGHASGRLPPEDPCGAPHVERWVVGRCTAPRGHTGAHTDGETAWADEGETPEIHQLLTQAVDRVRRAEQEADRLRQLLAETAGRAQRAEQERDDTEQERLEAKRQLDAAYEALDQAREERDEARAERDETDRALGLSALSTATTSEKRVWRLNRIRQLVDLTRERGQDRDAHASDLASLTVLVEQALSAAGLPAAGDDPLEYRLGRLVERLGRPAVPPQSQPGALPVLDLPPGWVAMDQPHRCITVLLHEDGAWTEIDSDALRGLTREAAASLSSALLGARQPGRHQITSGRADGVTWTRLERLGPS